MTTRQILSLVRAKILESTSDIISDATLLLYANLANQDLYKRSFTNDQILSATVTFTAGVGALPTLFGTLYGDGFKNQGDYFPEISIEDFKKQTLSQSVTIEGGQIKVFPTTTASLTIKYYPISADISIAPLVNSTTNSYFHELIVYGTIYRAYEDLQDQELSNYYKEKYEKELSQKIADQSNYEESNQTEGQLFNVQTLIGRRSSSDSSPNYF